MQQTIKPLGIATNPSDYDCPDGELAASFNIINEDGALRPLPQPVATNITLQDGDVIRCIHATSTFKHYIATCEDENNVNNTIAWYDPNADYDEENPRPSLALPNVTHIYKVTPIGNTLAVLTDSGLYYLLWKYDDNNNATYTNLGSKPPELELQFGVSETKTARYEFYDGTTETEQVGYVALRQVSYTDVTTSEDRHHLTEELWALINKANNTITQDNHFYAPFFVRYCYHMTDGSLIMHSAPVFIPVASPYTYSVQIMNAVPASSPGSYVQCWRYIPNNVELLYHVVDATQLTKLKNDWGDIVKSVDIFVSLPIIRETDSKDLEELVATPYSDQYRYVNKSVSILSLSDYSDYGVNWYPRFNLLPDNEYWEKIKTTSDFYLIASYDIEDPSTTTGLRTGTDNDHPDGFYEVNIHTGVLSTLAVQTAMELDYHSHNDILPTLDSDNHCITSLFNYNSRLSVAAATERLFKGFSLKTMLPAATIPARPTELSSILAVVVRIKTEQGIKTVRHDFSEAQVVPTLLLESLPLFYPDNRAFAMDFYIMNGDNQYEVFTLPMKQHPLINGATTNGALITTTEATGFSPHEQDPPTPDDTLTTLNQIRTSEVDNPFYYPAINYKRVGVGTILALSTSAKALSQGQFGQHPLYAFCTDGVWALGVDATDGTFVPAQPFTRDVCSNPDSILQLDSTVLFPTDRGIMLVSGSQTQCITEKLDYPHFDINDLRQCSPLLPQGAVPRPDSMREYINGCKMIYDYCNQHVIVFNSSYTYAYVYSLKSGLWAMMQADLVATLNAYPNAMAVNANRQLVKFPDASALNVSGDSPSQFSILNSQFYLTRPFKLGSNEHKTITALVQHGMIEDRQHVKLILYGSRDLVQWHVVGSSITNTLRGLSGTPYAAFRLAVIADLTATESLSDFVVEFTPKHTRVLK